MRGTIIILETMPMKTPQQPTARQMQKLIPKLAKTIEQYAAKGWSDSVGLQTARVDLQQAQEALADGNVDAAREKFEAAMEYLTSMAKEAMEDLRRRQGWYRRRSPSL
jgi:protoheme ferro-lyase